MTGYRAAVVDPGSYGGEFRHASQWSGGYRRILPHTILRSYPDAAAINSDIAAISKFVATGHSVRKGGIHHVEAIIGQNDSCYLRATGHSQ